MKSVNVILEGSGKGSNISQYRSYLITDVYSLQKPYVTSYTLINENNKSQYSFWKGALGVALLGGVGAVAGIGGKKTSEYLIAVEWKNGEKSLICLDDKFYKVFVQSMF